MLVMTSSQSLKFNMSVPGLAYTKSSNGGAMETEQTLVLT